MSKQSTGTTPSSASFQESTTRSSLYVELGGGVTPRGEGYVNVDVLDCADVHCDLETQLLPFEDDSVDGLYSSHCLEHVRNYIGVLREIARICKMGADVEIRVPYWLHPMANCDGHVQVISDREMTLWDRQPELFFPDGKKRLKLLGIHYQPDEAFGELRHCFPSMSDAQVLRYIPSCCHEIHGRFRCVAKM